MELVSVHPSTLIVTKYSPVLSVLALSIMKRGLLLFCTISPSFTQVYKTLEPTYSFTSSTTLSDSQTGPFELINGMAVGLKIVVISAAPVVLQPFPSVTTKV